MKTPALVMFLLANIIVTVTTLYFFWKVLTTPAAASPADEQPEPEVKSFDVT